MPSRADMMPDMSCWACWFCASYALADAVIRLLNNPAQATAMGQRGRERVMQHHSMDAYLDYLERVYKSAC